MNKSIGPLVYLQLTSLYRSISAHQRASGASHSPPRPTRSTIYNIQHNGGNAGIHMVQSEATRLKIVWLMNHYLWDWPAGPKFEAACFQLRSSSFNSDFRATAKKRKTYFENLESSVRYLSSSRFGAPSFVLISPVLLFHRTTTRHISESWEEWWRVLWTRAGHEDLIQWASDFGGTAQKPKHADKHSL